MAIQLTTLGYVHTAISVLALIPGFVSLFSHGIITPQTKSGKLYILLTVLACLTAFPIMKSGHPSPGHFLGILILIILPLAYYARSIKLFGQKGLYVQVILMTTTLYFSLVPAFSETLTRVPLGHPYAASPDDPAMKPVLLSLTIVFLAVVTFQIFKLRGQRSKLHSL